MADVAAADVSWHPSAPTCSSVRSTTTPATVDTRATHCRSPPSTMRSTLCRQGEECVGEVRVQRTGVHTVQEEEGGEGEGPAKHSWHRPTTWLHPEH